MAALTDEEKERVRYHLGYLNVQMAGSIQYGLPRPIQTLFILELAMDNLIDNGGQVTSFAVNRVRRILTVLDNIEAKLVDAQDRLAAEKLGELKIRLGEPDLLEGEYNRWARRLANQLGVPLYGYADRFKNSRAGSIPVRH